MCALIKPFDTNSVETRLEMYFHRKPVTQLKHEIAMRETSCKLKMIKLLFHAINKNQILTHEN